MKVQHTKAMNEAYERLAKREAEIHAQCEAEGRIEWAQGKDGAYRRPLYTAEEQAEITDLRSEAYGLFHTVKEEEQAARERKQQEKAEALGMTEREYKRYKATKSRITRHTNEIKQAEEKIRELQARIEYCKNEIIADTEALNEMTQSVVVN